MSFYELTSSLGKIQGQRFIDYFDGNDIKSWWTKTNITGSVTWSMEDNINEGLKGVTNTTNLARGLIGFNNIRQYDVRGFVFIASIKKVTTTETMLQTGMCSDSSSTPQRITALINKDDPTDDWELTSYNGTSASATSLSTVTDNAWHNVRVEGNASHGKMHLDGVFGAIKTTDLPTSQKTQPRFDSLSRNTSASDNRIRYMECWNT